jgi:hypothetical protein
VTLGNWLKEWELAIERTIQAVSMEVGQWIGLVAQKASTLVKGSVLHAAKTLRR